MARSKTLPARKPERGDESLLLRSAESLGRMIGTLQRQLDEATRHLSQFGNAASLQEAAPAMPRAKPTPRKASASKGSGGGASAAKRTRHASAGSASRHGSAATANGSAMKSRARKTTKKATRTR